MTPIQDYHKIIAATTLCLALCLGAINHFENKPTRFFAEPILYDAENHTFTYQITEMEYGLQLFPDPFYTYELQANTWDDKPVTIKAPKEDLTKNSIFIIEAPPEKNTGIVQITYQDETVALLRLNTMPQIPPTWGSR